MSKFMTAVGVTFGGGAIVFLFVLLLMIAPLIALASLNTIFEEAGIHAYIPHNVWTYLSVYGL